MISTNRYTERLRSHHDALAPLRMLVTPITDFTTRLQEMPANRQPRTIYIHTPFCTHNCTFCNLNRRRERPPEEYADLIVREIETYAAYRYVSEGRYDAIYFGGGTPTSLPPRALKKILAALHSHLHVIPGAEITIETTVSDLTEEHIAMFKESGVTRFSIGVQTFSPRGRHLLGRWGTGEAAIAKLNALLDAGFQDVGIDLIYNWPGQSEKEIVEDLEAIKSLDLAGLSFYALILMEGTTLHRMISADQCPPLGDLVQEKRFFDLILDELTGQGFSLLEFTKLVKPGRDEYRYVRIRYDNGDTLALGAGAGGRMGDQIYRNPSDLSRYRQHVENPAGPSVMRFSVNRSYDFANRLIGKLEFGGFEWSALEAFPNGENTVGAVHTLTKELAADGLVQTDSHGLLLTHEGTFWGNNIAQEFASTLAKAFTGGGNGHTSATHMSTGRGGSHPLPGVG